jgi:hypothetical protein
LKAGAAQGRHQRREQLELGLVEQPDVARLVQVHAFRGHEVQQLGTVGGREVERAHPLGEQRRVHLKKTHTQVQTT